MSTHKVPTPRLWAGAVVCGLVCLFGGSGLAMAAQDPVQITFTLEGCRNDGTFPLPNASGDYICPDANYVTGNLQKGWNELDLVPHRVTAYNNSGGNQTYSFIVAGDYTWTAGSSTGWDVISPLVLNTSLSDAGCNAAVSGPQTITPSGSGTGGADQTIYRLVTIPHPDDLTCVYDYYERLSLGSADFSGSSLQSNLWNQTLGSQGIGQKRVSIPVKDILPQELDKTMVATQDQSHAWAVTKTAPNKLQFDNTCDVAPAARQQTLQVQIQWTKFAAAPDGMVTVGTVITATNPATRTIDVQVVDKIYSGAVLLDEATFAPVPVPANTTNSIVAEHEIVIAAADAVDLNDVATATYVDDATGIPVPGDTEATASAPVQPSGITKNVTADLYDAETLSGSSVLTFSADSFAPPIGGFVGYTAGDPTVGPVNWTALAISESGSVTFDKTVYVSEPAIASGTLSDTVTLTGSDGFYTDGSASTLIETDALVELVIEKSIPEPLETGDPSLTFDFDVTGPAGYTNSVSITFAAGDPQTKSVEIGDLAPGTYNVTETEFTDLEPDVNPLSTTITLPVCEGTVSFSNNVPTTEVPRAKAVKVTDPAGSEAGWEFTLSGTDGTNEVGSTNSSGEILFSTPLAFGETYQIIETDSRIVGEPRDWDLDGYTGQCMFTPDFPADIGEEFVCTAKDVQRGTIIIKKETIPDADPAMFEFAQDVTADGNFFLGDGGIETFMYVVPGAYTVEEVDPGADWDLTSLVCEETVTEDTTTGGAVASIALDPAETVTCTYTNTKRGMAEVLKETNGDANSTMPWSFKLYEVVRNGTVSLIHVADDSVPPNPMDFGPAKLDSAKEYRLCETNVGSGWMVMWYADPDGDGTVDTLVPFHSMANDDPVREDGYSRVFDPNYVPAPDEYTNDTRCVNFVVEPGDTVKFRINNFYPGGEPRTIGYWKNWNTCTGGNQAATAAELGGPDEGWYIVDDLLEDPGYTIGALTLGAGDCESAVLILDKRKLSGNHKKMASDAAYNMAAQLLAAQLNYSAGAEQCPAATTAIADGQALLASIVFNGTANYLRSKDAEYGLAIDLGYQLDEYNNGFLCP